MKNKNKKHKKYFFKNFMLYFFIMKKIVVKNKDLKIFFRESSKFKKKMSRFLFDNTFYSMLNV